METSKTAAISFGLQVYQRHREGASDYTFVDLKEIEDKSERKKFAEFLNGQIRPYPPGYQSHAAYVEDWERFKKGLPVVI